MFIGLDKEYEVKCTLGTIRDIERAFDRSFMEIVQDISKMRTDDMIKLLYLGARRAAPDLPQDVFTALCEQYLGIGELLEILEKFFYALQYPGLSENEALERIEKKMDRAREMQRKQASTGRK